MKLFIKLAFTTLIFLALLVADSANANKDVQLRGQEGLTQMLELHKGDVIYLDFWASWCGPCRKSFPWMNDMQNKYHQQGFTVISINLDAEYDLAEKFLKEHPALFSVIYDPKGITAKKYQVKGMPTSYLIGRDGEIKKAHTGFFTKKILSYEDEIKQLIASKTLSN
ncbi:MAG: TlpA family protein disulfide reductase [Colwellia sp.]|nr:TlpA family protein disulfide reductase [Colwellia sp.]